MSSFNVVLCVVVKVVRETAHPVAVVTSCFLFIVAVIMNFCDVKPFYAYAK